MYIQFNNFLGNSITNNQKKQQLRLQQPLKNDIVSFQARPEPNFGKIIECYIKQLANKGNDDSMFEDIKKLNIFDKNKFWEYKNPETKMNFLQYLVFSNKTKLARRFFADKSLHEKTIQNALCNKDAYGDDALSIAYDNANVVFANMILENADAETLKKILTTRPYMDELQTLSAETTSDKIDRYRLQILNLIVKKSTLLMKKLSPEKVEETIQHGSVEQKAKLYKEVNLPGYGLLDKYISLGDVDSVFAILHDLKHAEFFDINRDLQVRINSDEKFRKSIENLGGKNLLDFARKPNELSS